jgi:glutamate/tyrosine decarboxylase-like PLP-dependent enzyme
MSKEKNEEEVMPRKFEDDLDYLSHSLMFIENAHRQAVEQLRDLKDQQMGLQEDMKSIKSPRLQQACGQIHNSLVMQQKEVRLRIKESRVDLKHVKSIYKKVKAHDK